MAGSHVRDPDVGSQPFSIDLIRQHIYSWERSKDPWGVKDYNYRFIYVNQAYLELLNLPNGYDVRGRKEDELRSIKSNLKDELSTHERMVVELGDRVTSLEVNFFGKNKEMQPYFFDKSPLFNFNGDFLGVTIHGKKAEIYPVNLLLSDDSPKLLYFDTPSSSFTKREWDVIFLLLRGFRYNLIAEELNLSVRTVRNNIQRLFVKTNVKSVDELMKYCNSRSYDYFFPRKYLHAKYQIL